MSSYTDTSFLFSYYASDANSTKADAWRQMHPDPLPFTVLHRLELRNAFELAVFQKRITATEAAELWAQIETDLNAGLLVAPAVSLLDLFQRAEVLARDHTSITGARSLDILHVGCAQLLASPEIVTFDLRHVKGLNPFSWIEPLLVWPFLIYAIVYAYREARRAGHGSGQHSTVSECEDMAEAKPDSADHA